MKSNPKFKADPPRDNLTKRLQELLSERLKKRKNQAAVDNKRELLYLIITFLSFILIKIILKYTFTFL